MDFDHSEQVKSLASLPPEPAKPAERSAWGAIPRGVSAAAAEVFSQLESLDPNRGMESRRAADDPIRMERERARARRTETADAAGDYARSLRPDPATASTAESVVFGLTRGLTKAGAAMAVLGPVAGAGAFGTSEAGVQFDDLTRQGVDRDTAMKAAAVTGVVSAGSVALPMFGSTLGKTAGLYVAGGPGGFMAQQALTGEILRRADYDKIALQFDPLDPVGLTLSALVPAPFAAFGAMRNVRAMRTQKPGSVDTSPAPVQEAPENVQITQDQADAAMVHNLTLIRDKALAQEAAIREEVGRPVETLAQFVERTKFAPEPEPPAVASSFVSWLKNRGGLSMAEKLDITGEPGGIRSNPGGIFRKGGAPSDDLAAQAVESGYLPEGAGSREFVELVQATVRGEPVLNVEQQARAAERASFETDMAQRLETMQRRLELLGVNPEEARGSVQAMEAYMRQYESALVDARIAEAADTARAAELPAREALPEPEQIATARQALEDFRDSGADIDTFIGSSTLGDDVKNLLVGLYEAGKDGARADRMLADFSRAMDAQRLRPAQDIAADVVEASRAGKTVTPEPVADAAVTVAPERAAVDSISTRLAEVETTQGDMVVRVEEDGTRVTVADEMARIRREAMEGTDDQLGSLDAELVRVAADCALSTGAM